MHIIKTLATSAILVAGSLSSSAAEWTSFQVGKVEGFSRSHDHLPDGRLVLGSDGKLLVQQTFGSPKFNSVKLGDNNVLDPSFVAVADATHALVGEGGVGESGIFPFNPAAPTGGLGASLRTLQNFNATYWRNPTSGGQGWLIGGGNGSSATGPFGAFKKHVVWYVSDDGTKAGPITDDLSTYSSGIAVDAVGNLYVGLAELSDSSAAASSNQVMKFSAASVDAAISAVLNAAPAPLALASATLVARLPSAGSLAVDGTGRVWAAGFETDSLIVYDPQNGLTRLVKPDHGALTGATGPALYNVKTFTTNLVNQVSFIVSDQYSHADTPIFYGYKTASDVQSRNVGFTMSAQPIPENGGEVTLTLTMPTPPTAKVTVPFTISGSATKGSDFNVGTSSVVFNAGEASKTVKIQIIDDPLDEPINNETIVVTLGHPTPNALCGLDPAKSSHTVTVMDNDSKPNIADVQAFPTLRVGTVFNYALAMGGGNILPAKYTAKGLPKGLKMDPSSGRITGTPTVPGEFAQVVITGVNSAGTTISVAFVMDVEDFPEKAHGSFAGIVQRDGTPTDGLGARVDLSTTAVATFTGKVTIGKKSYPIKGPLDTAPASPAGKASFIHQGTPMDLSFSISPADGKLTGTLNGPALLTPPLVGFRAKAGPDRLGLHNFAIASGIGDSQPEGNGFGSTSVSTKGVATTKGQTADGSPFTSTSPVSADGEFLVYQTLYSSPGSIYATLTIGGTADREVSGTVNWSKPPQTTGALYRSGWNPALVLAVNGGRYRPVSGSTSLLDAPPSANLNVTLTLSKAGLSPDPSTWDFYLLGTRNFGLSAPDAVTINNSTGAVIGSVGLDSQIVVFSGLIVPLTGTASAFDGKVQGWFARPTGAQGATRSGSVSIQVSATN